MNGEELWKAINNDLINNVIEVHTVPSTKRSPLWIKAYLEDGTLFVDNADEHTPKSSMSQRRVITKRDFLKVFSYYHRWLKGEKYLRQEVRAISRNTAYIFALIAEYDK